MKKNIVVLFGGESNEHEVSLRSAATVLRNLDKNKYNVYKAGIDRDGRLFRYYGRIDNIENGTWRNDARNEPCFFADGKLICVTSRIRVDALIPAVHGQNCEDGKIQGTLFYAKIPYVGCGCESSAVCMDKVQTKLIAEKYGIPVAKYIIAHRCEKDIVERVESYLPYPVFVKPARSGSSVGISKAKNRSELLSALGTAFLSDEKILIEETLSGKETEVALFCDGKGDIIVSQPGEIDSGVGFYDFDTKYKNQNARLFIPARISAQEAEIIATLAKKLFSILECESLARADFFVSEGKAVFNEINTFPGFTSISMYPRLMEIMGLSLTRLLDMLIDTARVK
ncbi:MAG: D-alanine--D-alanine ligase family protein [Eubacteriales bacterium]|nr:D-alanine--D-alanine ligase family protein [Eubacteriales bacterium]